MFIISWTGLALLPSSAPTWSWTLASGGGVAAWQTVRPDARPPENAPSVTSSGETPAERPAEPKVAAQRQPTDVERLQGVWNVVLLERDGEPVPLTEKASKHLVFVKDDKVMTHFLRVQEGPGYVTATVRLDTTTNPKTIEVLHGGGRLWEGIYLLEEDTMKVCIVPIGHKRPTTFATAANEPPMLVILKRDGSMVWDMAKWQKAVEEHS